eukprot:7894882-Pyramimonas_sp.AAC.1
MGRRLTTTAAAAPQQGATVERREGSWKVHARKLIDQFSIKFDHPETDHRFQWLLASVRWAANGQ